MIELNKWYFKLGIVPVWYRRCGMMAHFGIFKLHTRPEEGAMISRENIKGFWFRKEFDFSGFKISN